MNSNALVIKFFDASSKYQVEDIASVGVEYLVDIIADN